LMVQAIVCSTSPLRGGAPNGPSRPSKWLACRLARGSAPWTPNEAQFGFLVGDRRQGVEQVARRVCQVIKVPDDERVEVFDTQYCYMLHYM